MRNYYYSTINYDALIKVNDKKDKLNECGGCTRYNYFCYFPMPILKKTKRPTCFAAKKINCWGIKK